MMLYLNILINLTSCSTWSIFTNNSSKTTNIEPLLTVVNRFCSNLLNYLIKNQFYESISELLMKTLCRTRITIKKSALIAALTLSQRPLINSKFSDEIMILFIKNILSIPALLHQVSLVCGDNIKLFNSDLLVNCLNCLNNDKYSNQILECCNYSLCILANLVQFCYLNIEFLKANDNFLSNFIQIVHKILVNCGKYVVSKQSSLTHWHSILGWFSQSIDQR